MHDEHATRPGTSGPLPVTPLGYEAPRAEGWTAAVIRWFAVAGMVMGLLHLAETVAQLAAIHMQVPLGWGNWRNAIGMLLELARSAASVTVIVAGFSLMRLRGQLRVAAVVAA